MVLLKRYPKIAFGSSFKVRKIIENCLKNFSFEILKHSLTTLQEGEYNVKVNVRDVDDYGHAIFQSGYKDPMITRFLLNQGLDPNEPDEYGNTYLHSIFSTFHTEDIKSKEIADLFLLYEYETYNHSARIQTLLTKGTKLRSLKQFYRTNFSR